MNPTEITAADFPEIARFWSVQLRATNVNQEPDVLEMYLEWLGRNPWRSREVPLGWVVRADGQVAGIMLALLHRFELNGQPVDAALCTQYYVAPEHRSLGTPIFLTFRALNQHFPIYVCGASPTTAAMFRAIGAKAVFPSTGYELLRVLDWGPVVEDRIMRRLPPSIARAGGAIARMLIPGRPSESASRLEPVTPEQAAALPYPAPPDTLVLKRTAEYLQWRAASPFFSGGGYFRFRRDESATDCALGLVLRPRGLKNTVTAVSLLDLWGTLGPRACLDLVAAIECEFRGRTDAIALKFLNPEQEEGFLAHGFRKRMFPAPTAFLVDKDGLFTKHEWRLTASATDLI